MTDPAVAYLEKLLDLVTKAERDIGGEAAYQATLLVAVTAASRHKSTSAVCDWLEQSAREMRARITRH